MKTLRSLCSIVFGFAVSLSAASAQGPLAPPGPPGETMRTLQQIEPRTPISSVPFTITQPGSYFLTQNVSGSTQGIWIAASDVHLDLNGFTVSGDKFVFGHGLIVVPSDNVSVQGGVIKNWGGNGIEAPEVTNLVVENVALMNNAGHGIHFSSGALGGVDSQDNGGAGIFASKPVPGIGVIVKKHPKPSHVQRNGGGGVVIEGDFDAELSGVIHGNTGHGISWAPATPADGLRLKLEDCDSSHNTGDGLHLAGTSSAEARCEMADVSFNNNGGGGVFVSKPVPGIGIVVKKNPGSGARIAGNDAGGLVLEGDCNVEFAGEVSDNTGHGISWTPLDPADRITFKAKEGASVHNTGDGLRFAAAGPVDAVCDLADFTCERNGGDGLHIALPHPDSRLDLVHHQGRLLDNAGDGYDIAAGQNGRQGFFDIAMARNGGDGCNKVDGGSNPGAFVRCVVQDNVGRGLDLVGGSWTLESSVVKNNGSDGVAIGAKKHTKTGHVTLLKRTTAVEDNQGHGVTVYPAEADATCDVVVENSRSTGNTGDGYHLDAGVAGSGTFRDSVVQGNDGRGLDLTGGSWTLEYTAVNDNGSDGVAVAAKKEFKGHVTLLKRGGSTERNAGDGIRVVAAEADAECRVVLERAHLAGNGQNGLHVAAALSGSSIDLDWLDSSASGNGGSGMLIVPVAMDKGLRFRAEGGDCDDNVAGGLTVDGDAVEVGSAHGLSLRGNGTWGVNARGGIWRFADCTATDNPEGGFRLNKPGTAYQDRWGDFAFADCDAFDNGVAGIAVYGFDAAATARVDIAGGRVAANSGVGIDLSSSPGTKGRIHGVVVADNAGHGIYSEGSGWSITDNRVAGNANTGIFVAGNSHHVAHNELTDNAIGIYLEGTGSAVRENTFSGLAPGGGLPQTPYVDGSGANAAAPVQDVPTGVNPLGNVVF